jgi:hypothetical protein
MSRTTPILTLALAAALSTASAAQEPLSPLARSIQDDLNRLDSRVPAPAGGRLQSDRIQRTTRDRGRVVGPPGPTELRSPQDIARSSDLGAARQDLRTLKTQEPNAGSVPVLEQQLDRLGRESRGTTLFQPSRSPPALYGR